MVAKKVAIAPLAVGALLAMSACAASSDASAGGGDSAIEVGIVTGLTGDFSSQGASYSNGFAAGLDYATKGTNKINGHTIKVVIKNSAEDPATATAQAKSLLGEGAKFIIGPTSSAVAVPVAKLTVANGATYITGASGTSATVGMDANVFNSGEGSPVYNQALLSVVPSNTKLALVAVDYAYSQNLVATLKPVAAARGITVDPVLLPQTTTDFTAGMAKLKATHAGTLYVSWQGNNQGQLYSALKNAGIYQSMNVVSILQNVASYPQLAQQVGSALPKLQLICGYFPGAAPENPAQTAMIAYAKKTNAVVDYVHPNGFDAGLMVAHAIEASGSDVTKASVSKALSGWTFDGPLGSMTIRAADHMMVGPMFLASLSWDGTTATPHLTKMLPPSAVVPPVTTPIK